MHMYIHVYTHIHLYDNLVFVSARSIGAEKQSHEAWKLPAASS